MLSPGIIKSSKEAALDFDTDESRGNVFDHLVRQYLQREPENRVLGSEEEPIAWQSLDLGQKVQIIWQLCEWQLDDPSRFRSLLSSESDAASWVRSTLRRSSYDSASTR